MTLPAAASCRWPFLLVLAAATAGWVVPFNRIPHVQAFGGGHSTLPLSSFFASSKTRNHQLYASTDSSTSDTSTFVDLSLELAQFFFLQQSATFVTLTLKEHKPLGCRVEESLAVYQNDTTTIAPLFVSKVQEKSHAAQGGLQVGDVLIGLSGVYGSNTNVTSVAGLPLSKIKQWIGSHAADTPLTVVVARGTSVVQDHEAAMVELCALDTESSKNAQEQCIVDYLTQSYELKEEKEDQEEETVVEPEEEAAPTLIPKAPPARAPENNNIPPVECDEPNVECLIDDMHQLWLADLSDDDNEQKGNPKKISEDADADDDSSTMTTKPWSSRSSPSGTFVRDPNTGEMKNIG